MKNAVIVNPVSGQRRSLRILPKLVSWANDRNIEFKVFTTNRPGEATRLARLAMFDGFNRIVVVGGDGTINEVGQATLGSKIPLGIIPGGSGNDLYRMFGGKMSLEESFANAFEGEAHDIDVGVASGNLFFNAIGIGFDAQVAARVPEYKKLTGTLRYLAGVIHVWRHFTPIKLDIELDSVKVSHDVTLVCIGNGRTTGGGFHLTPQALLDDGLFDICIIEGVSKSKIFKYLPRTIKGTHVRLPGVRVFRSRRVVIKASEPFPVHIDGEIMKPYPDKLEITFEKRKLKLAMPEKIA